MPNSFLPPVEQGTKQSKKGAILIGDSWNMRHPLTGGGMTVAFNDVVLLRKLLGSVDDFREWTQIQQALHNWHWNRKPLASTVNILSVALYDLFGADGTLLSSAPTHVTELVLFRWGASGAEDRLLQVLRMRWRVHQRTRFATVRVSYLMRALDGTIFLIVIIRIAPDPMLLAYHFFYVAFYSIWVMFIHPAPISTEDEDDEKPVYARPSIIQYPALSIKAVRVVSRPLIQAFKFWFLPNKQFWTACVVFGPLLWTEIRWWSSNDSTKKTQLPVSTLLSIAVLAAATVYSLPSLALLGVQWWCFLFIYLPWSHFITMSYIL